MSLRGTVFAMFMLVAMCGGALWMLNSTFSRDAQMRQAERDFRSHDTQLAATSRPPATSDAFTPDEPTVDSDEETPSLDDWYADAGKTEGPVDTTPADDGWLINSTEPFE